MSGLVDYDSDASLTSTSSSSSTTATASVSSDADSEHSAAAAVSAAASSAAALFTEPADSSRWCRIADCPTSGTGAGKYTCPGCDVRFCSVACSRLHKERDGCTGRRNPVAAVEIGALSTEQLQAVLLSDFRFLEEASRRADAARRLCADYGTLLMAPSQRGSSHRDGEGGPAAAPPPMLARIPHDLHQLLRHARARGVWLRLMPRGMSRHDRNTSHWKQARHKKKKKQRVGPEVAAAAGASRRAVAGPHGVIGTAAAAAAAATAAVAAVTNSSNKAPTPLDVMRSGDGSVVPAAAAVASAGRGDGAAEAATLLAVGRKRRRGSSSSGSDLEHEPGREGAPTDGRGIGGAGKGYEAAAGAAEEEEGAGGAEPSDAPAWRGDAVTEEDAAPLAPVDAAPTSTADAAPTSTAEAASSAGIRPPSAPPAIEGRLFWRVEVRFAHAASPPDDAALPTPDAAPPSSTSRPTRADRGYMLALDAVEDTTPLARLLLPYVGPPAGGIGGVLDPAAHVRARLGAYVAAMSAPTVDGASVGAAVGATPATTPCAGLRSVSSAATEAAAATHVAAVAAVADVEDVDRGGAAALVEVEGPLGAAAVEWGGGTVVGEVALVAGSTSAGGGGCDAPTTVSGGRLHPLLLFLEHPLAVAGRTVYHRIKSPPAAAPGTPTPPSTTLRDALRGRIVIEFPTLVVALPGTEAQFPLLEPPPRPPPRRDDAVAVEGLARPGDAQWDGGAVGSLLGPPPAALRRHDVAYGRDWGEGEPLNNTPFRPRLERGRGFGSRGRGGSRGGARGRGRGGSGAASSRGFRRARGAGVFRPRF